LTTTLGDKEGTKKGQRPAVFVLIEIVPEAMGGKQLGE